MKMKKLSLILLLPFMLTNCSKDAVQFNVSMKQKSLIEADNSFGFELFKQINSATSEDKNLFISPLSISMALSMTLNGAAGTTLEGMKTALQLPTLTTQEINEINQFLLDKLISLDPKVRLAIANSIWYRKDFYVLPDFLTTNQKYYQAQVSPLDFSGQDALKTINNWVYDQTGKKIEKIVNQIDPEDVMFLINAIYFKGDWKMKFDKNKTADEDFYLSDGNQLSVPFMKQKITANYYTNDNVEAIELPYGRGNYSMVVMVPKGNYSVTDLINGMNSDTWKSWKKEFSETKDINLKLPKFRFEYEITLNDILSAMGMQEAFSDQADFTGINPIGQLYISEVKHKSFIEVNEEGTEAAAATSVGISFTSVPQEIWFSADKPFLFFITELNTGCILFMGKIARPE